MTPKRREPCVLFLDDGFDSPESNDALTAAGFCVRRFRDHFKRDGRKREGIPDPSVISLCAENKWLLVTTDWNMQFTHTDVIKSLDVAILATANNNHPVAVWVSAIVKARASIERTFKKQPRPYFSRLSKDGNITKTKTITPDMKSKRYRPGEKVLKNVMAAKPLD